MTEQIIRKLRRKLEDIHHKIHSRGKPCTCRGDSFLGDIYQWDYYCPYHNWYARQCGEEYPYID